MTGSCVTEIWTLCPDFGDGHIFKQTRRCVYWHVTLKLADNLNFGTRTSSFCLPWIPHAHPIMLRFNIQCSFPPYSPRLDILTKSFRCSNPISKTSRLHSLSSSSQLAIVYPSEPKNLKVVSMDTEAGAIPIPTADSDDLGILLEPYDHPRIHHWPCPQPFAPLSPCIVPFHDPPITTDLVHLHFQLSVGV